VQYWRDDERAIIYTLFYSDKFIYFHVILKSIETASSISIDTEKTQALKLRIEELLNEQTSKSTVRKKNSFCFLLISR